MKSSRKRIGEGVRDKTEDPEPASKRVATERLADALEDSTRTPLPDDNTTKDPDVFCSEAVSSNSAAWQLKPLGPLCNASEQALMSKAKAREWSAWLDTDAVEACRREGIPRERIIGSRDVLTVMPDGTRYFDPDVTKVIRDAHTLSAVAEHLLIQLCTSEGWWVGSLDVRTAFLAGDNMDRNLYMQVPSTFRKELKLSSNDSLKLQKAVYGLLKTPKEWFKPLHRELTALEFKASTLDICFCCLPKTSRYGVHGVVGAHVDDLIGGGDDTFS